MKALKVYVRPQNSGFGVDYKDISFEKYRGLLGKLGLEKVIAPDHSEQDFYVHFNSLDDIADDVVERAKLGYKEVHTIASNPYFYYSLRRKIWQISPGIKLANPIRIFALSLEQFLKIFPRRDDYFRNIHKHWD